jgi:hypothetical protein
LKTLPELRQLGNSETNQPNRRNEVIDNIKSDSNEVDLLSNSEEEGDVLNQFKYGDNMNIDIKDEPNSIFILKNYQLKKDPNKAEQLPNEIV